MHIYHCGVFKITAAAGETAITEQDGDEHNPRKMSVILVEGVS